MALKWVAVNLLTGAIVCDLPSLIGDEPFRRTIGQYETSTVALLIPNDGTIDPDWELGILEWSTALIAYRGDPGSEVVVWGGVVNEAPRGLGNMVQLSLITIEGYLDRCYTGSYLAVNVAQNQICADLVNQFCVATIQGIPGIPITVTQLPEPPGVTGNTQRSFSFNDFDDKTVYGNLQDMMGLAGGPEWTMHWAWNHTTNRITPTFTVGTRIGTGVTSGLGPAVTFDEANLLDATVGRSYAVGKGANIVTTVAPGQGLGRVQATATAAANGRPHIEYRYSPSTSVFDQPTLMTFASGAVAAIGNGSMPITLEARNDLPGSQIGVDWNLGDDIGYSLKSPSIPNRRQGVVRCIGYEATDQTIIPTIAGTDGLL